MFFSRVGLGVGELRRFEIVGVGEEHRWSDDGVNLVHCFHFVMCPASSGVMAKLVSDFPVHSTYFHIIHYN